MSLWTFLKGIIRVNDVAVYDSFETNANLEISLGSIVILNWLTFEKEKFLNNNIKYLCIN